MADTDLTATGKNTSIQVVLDGVVIQVQDRVKSFAPDLEMDEVRSKYLGQSGSSIAQEFSGYKGTLEVEASTAAVDELQDAIVAAAVARVPLLINIVETTYYNDGTSKTYTYPDCKLTFSKRVSRGEATTVSINWMTGKPRIAA